MMHPVNSSTEQFQYLQDFTTASGIGADPHASIINAYIFTGQGPTLIANQFTYTKATPFPSIFNNFTKVPQLTQHTLRTTNLTDLTIELGQSQSPACSTPIRIIANVDAHRARNAQRSSVS